LPVLLTFFVATVSFPITNWLRNRRGATLAGGTAHRVDFSFIAQVIVLAVNLISDLQRWDERYTPSFRKDPHRLRVARRDARQMGRSGF
jgi:AI-2 transport protein TqsA